MIDGLLVQITTSYINHGVRHKEPQLGQYYIAEYAHTKGFSIKIKKFISTDPIVSQLSKIIEDTGCRLVGFYVDCLNIWTIRRVLLKVKEKAPNVIFVIGGPQVTGNPELAMKRIAKADIAIIGEGERPIVQLLSINTNDKNSLSDISGIYYRDESGKINFTKKQHLLKLSHYPYPKRHRYSLDKDIIFDQISTGRGCVGKCAFCFEGSKKNNTLRLRDIEDVIDEIDYVIANLHNQKFFSFLDDTFVINPERTQKICKHLIEKYQGSIRWFCEARVDVLYEHLDLIPLMVEAGLLRVQLGGESGSQKILDIYKKNMKIEQLRTVVKTLYQCGVPSIYINFIIGGAFENYETFNETLELAKDLMKIAPGCAEVGCSIFTPYVGTPMYLTPEKYGINIIDKNILSGLDGFMSFSETTELNRYKIAQLYSLFEWEIAKEMLQLCETLPYNQMLQRFELYRDFGLADSWMEKIKRIEAVDKYFNAILETGFFTIKDLTIDTIQGYVPYRTKEPISDGESFFINTYKGKYNKLEGLEESVYLLSSGKICFNEIVYLISKRGYPCTYEELELNIYNIYLEFDRHYLVVWKEDL